MTPIGLLEYGKSPSIVHSFLARKLGVIMRELKSDQQPVVKLRENFHGTLLPRHSKLLDKEKA